MAINYTSRNMGNFSDVISKRFLESTASLSEAGIGLNTIIFRFMPQDIMHFHLLNAYSVTV